MSLPSDSPEMIFLRDLSGVPLSSLGKENDMIIIPPGNQSSGDEDKQPIITLYRDGSIATGNLMGYVGNGDVTFSITSRFTTQPDYFLHYMLSRAMSVRLLDLDHPYTTDSQLNLLIYLFPYYLKRALSRGIYRCYTSLNKNDAAIKGTVNIPRHLRHNIPFSGKIAYSSRERLAANHITQLIRHTIETIRQLPNSHYILAADRETSRCVAEITESTPSYQRNLRERVIHDNIKPVNHPYFIEYTPLQHLCLMILRRCGIHYNGSRNHFNGIIFDGAWLWESYLDKVIREKSGKRVASTFRHPDNRKSTGAIHLFNSRRKHGDLTFSPGSFYPRYPDFITAGCVIDAKYKLLDDHRQLQRDDCHQLISYMHILNLDKGIFIFPHTSSDVIHYEYTLNGLGGRIIVIGVPIPQNAVDYRGFSHEMAVAEGEVCRILEGIEGGD